MTQVIGTDPAGPGVEGESNVGTGVEGTSNYGIGVEGTSKGIGAGLYSAGVYGESDSNSGFGVDGFCTSGTGVRGNSPSGTGVWGESDSGFGVVGMTVRGYTAVLGLTFKPNGLAGYFSGDVEVTGTINKSATMFKIDHPLDPANKYLFHSGVESPDMKNLYDGVAVLDAQGEIIVELPLWFEALNQEFRYQLTPIGAPGPNLYIAEEISDQQFKIAGGTPGMKVCWQITGSRKDAWAQAHPLIVEQEKSATERDHYLHPEVHGHSQEQSIARLYHPDPQVLRRSVKEQQQKTRED